MLFNIKFSRLLFFKQYLLLIFLKFQHLQPHFGQNAYPAPNGEPHLGQNA